MPPPPLKLRLLLLLPLVPSILGVLLLVMLLVNTPLPFVNRPMCKVWYEGGTITYTGITSDVWTGPRAETVNGPYGLVYKNFKEKTDWENALPKVNFARLGISYSSSPHARVEGTNFVADKRRELRIGAEYLIALAVACLFWTVLLYLRARRAYQNLCRGFCQACGYDLRATPDRCPECGAMRA